MNTRTILAAASASAALILIVSCAATNQQPVTLFPGMEKAQVPQWSPQDMDFFLHGSISTEFVPQSVLRAFIVIYPDLFPKSDLSNLGLIPDPDFGWPVGFSRSRPAHLGNLLSVGVNCAACHTGEIEAPQGASRMRVIGMTSRFDVEALFGSVMAATYRTASAANMKRFLSEYLNQSDVAYDSAERDQHQKQFEAAWQSQLEKTEAAIAADPTGSKGAGPGDLQTIDPTSLQLTGERLRIGVDMPKLAASMLKLFHNMRAALHVPDAPPTGPTPAAGPGRADAFGLLSAILFHESQPYAPVKYGLLWNLQDRPAVDWDANVRPPLARNLLASVGLGAPVVDHHAEIYFSLVQQQTTLTQNIAPPRYPFAINHAAARRGALYYQVSCMSCHEGDQDDTRLYSLTELGTDPLRATLFTPAKADLFNNFLATLQLSDYTPFKQPPLRSTQKYYAPNLAGVWARSPYLHNGSVRTLQELLTAPEDRPKSFHRGSPRYDENTMGYTDSGSYQFDATKPGNQNTGHNYGTAFTPDQKRDLIEYLKTL